MFVNKILERINEVFGCPIRETAKVFAWDIQNRFGVVVQVDQPRDGSYGIVWLPYPAESSSVPEIAMEYAGESGRHSNTYASLGLKKGLPALKLRITSDAELDDLIQYIKAFKEHEPLPDIKSQPNESEIEVVDEMNLIRIDTSIMPKPKPMKPRREAIPRSIQTDVWQRDGGKCVQCDSNQKLCFDHIVPFSKGGSNSYRNLQLLCEQCNLSKGNRI